MHDPRTNPLDLPTCLPACLHADHDLNTKTARIVEFLKEGRPVRVVVSLTLSAWTQEEPARREVYARILRRVRTRAPASCSCGKKRKGGMCSPCI